MTTYLQDGGVDFLYDSHCHLSPTVTHEKYDQLLTQLTIKVAQESAELPFPPINLMSTNEIDYKLVHELSVKFPKLIAPNYGVHPWFCHLYTLHKFEETKSDDEIKREHYAEILLPKVQELDGELFNALPVPMYLPDYLQEVEALLEENPNAGIGEVGIDKAFRVPMVGYLGSSDAQGWNDPKMAVELPKTPNESWSQFRTDMGHQIEVLTAFLALAKKHNRSISLHCVGNHGKLYEVIKRELHGYESSRIALHSYSGSVEQIKCFTQTFPRIKFSVSSVLNLERYKVRLQNAFDQRYLAPKNIMLESDLGLDGLYWDDGSGGVDDDRYELLVSRKKGPLNRHTYLLKDTADQLHEMNSKITLESLDASYKEYQTTMDVESL